MKLLRTRRGRLAVATLAQLALVPVAVAAPLSARITGETYVFEVAPLDPIDPFRGAYVALDYPGLPAESTPPAVAGGGGEVYVPLVRADEVWTGGPAVATQPEAGPFLRCHDDGWRLSCGIESWFLPQDEALAMEQAVRGGDAVAEVRIDRRGNAALVDVRVVGSS